MQHISRIYIGNYGHKMCWYDGLILSLTDKDTGLPCDHILHLENGGGKSTLLGGIFSCFEPRQDRFLKTLHDPRNKFSDYFREDGVPGFIVIEWQNRFESNHALRRTITGQAIARKNSITSDLERIFFHFETSEALNLESMPLPKLSEKPVQNIRDCLAWVQKMQIKHRGNFYYTRSQSDWERSVEAERGIDIGLLKQQLEFSRQEGAVDAFLNFKTETEFLRKLLGLTMNEERAMSVRDSIALACDRLRDKPKQELRLKLLRECEGVLENFAQAALEFEVKKAAFSQVQSSALTMATTLDLRISRSKHDLENKSGKKSEIEASIALAHGQKQELTFRLEGASFEHLRRVQEEAKSIQLDTRNNLSIVETEIRLLNAARSHRQVVDKEMHLDELTRLSDVARQELEPFAMEAVKAASLFKKLLSKEVERLKSREMQLESEIQSGRERCSDLDSELRALLNRRVEFEKALAKLEILELNHSKERMRLFQSNHLNSEHEPVESAMSRAEHNYLAIKSEIDAQKQLQESLSRQIEDLQLSYDELILVLSKSKLALSSAEEQLTLGENLRELLSNDPILCSLSESDFVDPDAQELDAILSNATLHLRHEADLLAIALERLKACKTEFEATGLAGGNSDVAAVISLLSEGGVRSAIAFNAYIARVIPDADEARALISSNPARFLSVGVQNEEELDLVRKILPSKANVLHPVMVSATTQQLEDQRDVFVVHPLSDAAFNFEAAKLFAQDLSESIGKAEHARQNAFNKLDQIGEVVNRRSHYIKQFGHGLLMKLSQDASQLKNDVDSLTGQQRHVSTEMDTSRQSERESREKTSELLSSAQQAQEVRRELARFISHFESPFFAERANLQGVRELLDDLESDTLAKEHAKKACAALLEENVLSKQALVAEIGSATSELREVSDADSEVEPEENFLLSELTLQSARALYQNHKKILETEESLRLGLLGHQLASCRTALSEAKTEYEKNYGNLDTDEVVAVVERTADVEEALISHNSKLSDLKQSLEEAAVNFKVAESAFRDFRKKHSLAEEYAKQFLGLFAHEELINLLADLERELTDCTKSLSEFDRTLKDIEDEIAKLVRYIELVEFPYGLLIASIDDYSSPDVEMSGTVDENALSADPKVLNASVLAIIEDINRAAKVKSSAAKVVENRFREVQSFAQRPDLLEVESAVATHLSLNDLQDSISNAASLSNSVKQRIDAVESVLLSLNKDFEESLEELVNLVGEGLHVLTAVCAKRLPENAPYIGGKPVVKMRASFPPSHADTRRQILGSYMNRIIEGGFPQKNGTDMVADAITEIANGSLGIQIVKLIRDPSEQYVAVNKLSNSGGEAVSMAMFLYLLIARLRAELQAKSRQQVGGPLILDNPFAKATSSFIWRAQRDLANALGVQLVIATALPDYNALGEFSHFIRLRRAGRNDKTGRWHIEHSEFSFIN